MHLTIEPLDLRFTYPFGTARDVKTHTYNVLVTITHEGITGYGEGAPNVRYHESQAGTIGFLKQLDLNPFQSPAQLDDIMDYAEKEAGDGFASARAALDLALHDWVSKSQNKPLCEYWGVPRTIGPVTSFTIGLAEPALMAQKTREAEAYPILKIKVGTPADQATIGAIRSITNKTIRVDANEGWKTKEEALEKIHWLKAEGIEFVEQPMPANRLKDLVWLKARSPLPLVADEDCMSNATIPSLVDAYHGINIKLDKAGGLREGRRMIETARKHDLKVMIGCMAGSSISMSAGAHLALMADWADLDGHVLLAEDPFDGVKIIEGRLVLPNRPGLGVVSR